MKKEEAYATRHKASSFFVTILESSDGQCRLIRIAHHPTS